MDIRCISAKVIMKLLEAINDEAYKTTLLQKLAPPLVTLLSSEPEVQYVALRNINLVVQKYSTALSNHMKVSVRVACIWKHASRSFSKAAVRMIRSTGFMCALWIGPHPFYNNTKNGWAMSPKRDIHMQHNTHVENAFAERDIMSWNSIAKGAFQQNELPRCSAPRKVCSTLLTDAPPRSLEEHPCPPYLWK